jgi:ribosome maturation factor RimP
LPSQKQVIELLDGEFARAGYEIEDVLIDTAARPPRITVVADGDEPLDLDSIAALSRSASTARRMSSRSPRRASIAR